MSGYLEGRLKGFDANTGGTLNLNEPCLHVGGRMDGHPLSQHIKSPMSVYKVHASVP